MTITTNFKNEILNKIVNNIDDLIDSTCKHSQQKGNKIIFRTARILSLLAQSLERGRNVLKLASLSKSNKLFKQNQTGRYFIC